MDFTHDTIELFHTYKHLAVLLSIVFNIVISILGVVPSVFLTAANLAVFGFAQGMWISFLGESIGAILAFLLYRKGLSSLQDRKGFSHPKIQRLLHATKSESFLLILSLRLMPFVPSGLVTFIASIGKTTLLIFATASSLGKIPAILIEGFSVNEVMNVTTTGKLLMALFAVTGLVLLLKRLR